MMYLGIVGIYDYVAYHDSYAGIFDSFDKAESAAKSLAANIDSNGLDEVAYVSVVSMAPNKPYTDERPKETIVDYHNKES